MRQVGHLLQRSKQEDDTGGRNVEESDSRDIFEVAGLGNRMLSVSGVKEVKEITPRFLVWPTGNIV